MIQQMTLKEAHLLTLRVLKQVMEEKLDQHNVQLAQAGIMLFLVLSINLQLDPTGHTREGLRDSGQCGSAGGDRCHVNALSLH